MQKEVIKISGMKCEHCVARVSDTLKKLKVKAKVSLDNSEAIISYDANKISLDEIKKAINDLGFNC